MNVIDVGAWKANRAWSLPLIVLTVVIHVIGLGLPTLTQGRGKGKCRRRWK
jgi:hypothetical protein